MTPIEKVARAIAGPGVFGTPREHQLRGAYIKMARAAIQALMSPSEGMVLAGSNVSMELSAQQVFHEWQAMLTAALEEE